MTVSKQVYYFFGTCGIVITQSVILSLIFKKKINKQLHSPTQSSYLFYFMFTIFLTLMLGILSLLTMQIDYKCGSLCAKVIRMGLSFNRKKVILNLNIEHTFYQNKFYVYLEFCTSIISIYYLIKIFTQKQINKQNKEQYFSQYFNINDKTENLLKAIANTEIPFISVSNTEYVFGLDHLCPWTGRNISHENMLQFIYFLILATIGTVSRLIRSVIIIIQEYKFLRLNFPDLNKFLLIPALYASLDGNQIFIYFIGILSIVFLIVAGGQCIYQVFFNSRHVINSSLRQKIFDVQKRIKNNTLVVVCQNDTYILMPYPIMKTQEELQLWKDSLGQIISTDDIKSAIVKCTIGQKIKYLKSFYSK
ncbi:Palmitoyltransferase [Spironucleus salmonicida]|uniref:Palmitoyltransferase n=1 Tax=Spironucleus salmonicida TaxID=348837 RepID=V6LV87_9EUKA|nr:Palmitoyltransferase [Spironucleus salmonicida]|eukprot:EST47626.1 DHHC zinc finger domain and transmembrane domain-containing protein [Spironucleus salmonicida]